jgi:hypothetical protein
MNTKRAKARSIKCAFIELVCSVVCTDMKMHTSACERDRDSGDRYTQRCTLLSRSFSASLLLIDERAALC